MVLMRWIVMILMLLGLGACSNSNNLHNPTNDGSASVESACDPTKDGLCVSGQFVSDQAVAGVNYTCGNVQALTDDSGFFSCPAESTITLSIKSFNSDKEIVLGKATVQPVLSGSVSPTAQTTVGSVVISVSDLAGLGPGPNGGANLDPSDPKQLSSTLVEQALNIARFLNAINSNTVTDPATNSPVPEWEDASFSGLNSGNRIIIDETTRLALAGLQASISGSSVWQQSDLTPALKAFVASIPGRSLSDIPSMSIEQNILQAFMIRSNTGAYLAASAGCDLSGYQLIPDGMCNTSGGSLAPKSGNLLFFVDHAGYGYGYGMTTTAAIVSDNPVPYPFYIPGTKTTDPNNSAVQVVTPPSRPIGYYDGALKLDAVSYQSTDGQTPQTSPSMSPAPVQWTGTVRQGAIAGTTDIYKTLFNVVLSPSTTTDKLLGAWTYGTANDNWYVPSGQLTLFNIKPANPYLDANVFGAGKTFPINLHLTFVYDDGTCTSTPSCKTLSQLDISILKTGDIVTNSGNDCNRIVDPTAAVPVNSSNVQQARIGYVSTVNVGSDASGASIYYASLTLLLPEYNVPVSLIPAELQGAVVGIFSSNLLLVAMNGDNAFTITRNDNVEWVNFFLSSEDATPPDTANGLLLVQAQDAARCPG